MSAEKAAAAWEPVFSVCHSALQAFLRRRVTHPWDVEDLAQEVYVRMLRIDDGRAKAIADPRAYLFTVAANLVKEHAMLQKRNSRCMEISQVVSGLETPEGDAQDAAERAQRRQRVAAMLEGLPPRCRAVLIMQHRDGMTYAEIADKLGVSTHMVKKYVVKALAMCRANQASRK